MNALAPSPDAYFPTASADRFRALVSGQKRGMLADLQRGGLRLASIPYRWAMQLRNGLFDRGWKHARPAGVPVVCVGNLTLGGTGKTPCAEYIARFYREHDLRVAILSRGYGNSHGRNDEALVLEENLPDVPHLQGADRVSLAEIATGELQSEVLVLDDGFQHRRLARDLDIVLVDATNPWGYGYLFPRGLMREPPSSLQRAQVVLLTRCDQTNIEQREQLHATIARLAPRAIVAETVHQPLDLCNSETACLSLDHLRRRPVAAFCGLGNPDAFQRTLHDLGADMRAFRSYPDHHPYTRTDVEDLRAWARQQATDCLVVTTQKDLVKLRLAQLGGRALYALRIRLHLASGQAELDRQLLSIVGQNQQSGQTRLNPDH